MSLDKASRALVYAIEKVDISDKVRSALPKTPLTKSEPSAPSSRWMPMLLEGWTPRITERLCWILLFTMRTAMGLNYLATEIISRTSVCSIVSVLMNLRP